MAEVGGGSVAVACGCGTMGVGVTMSVSRRFSIAIVLGVKIVVKSPVLFEALGGAVVGAFGVCFASEAENALDGGIAFRVDPANLCVVSRVSAWETWYVLRFT